MRDQGEIDRCRRWVSSICTPMEAARRRARNLAHSQACTAIMRMMPHNPRAAHALFERWFQMRRGGGGANNPFLIAGASSGTAGLQLWYTHLSASVATAPGTELTRRGRLVSSRYERLVLEARSTPASGDDLSYPFTEDEYARALKRMKRGAASAGGVLRRSDSWERTRLARCGADE